jgi:hypothetical protein
MQESDQDMRHEIVNYFISLRSCDCYDELISDLQV